MSYPDPLHSEKAYPDSHQVSEKPDPDTLRSENPGAVDSVADTGCLSRIPDPTFSHPGSELSLSRIRVKEFKYFNPQKTKKNGFQVLENMIRVVHPGSGC